MKKYICFIFIYTLGLGFVGCGGNEDEPPQDKFTWNGDWNDPNDPNYKPDGYNLIQGLWKYKEDGTKGLYYSEDFKEYGVVFYEDGTHKKSEFYKRYIINDTAFKLNDGTWRYIINKTGTNLSMTPYLNEDKDWRHFEKIIE